MSDPGTFNAPSIAELQPHFPQFSIERFVAEGGMGAVYHATQRSVDRSVALKILPPALAGNPEFHRRFVMEAKAMAKLSHRNLVQLYDFGQSGEIMWMIQEWVEGRNFHEIIGEEERLAPEEAAALVAQVCDGLGYAHRQGIVHRDVKPANVMQDKDGLVKVMDFGLARTMQGGAEGPHVAGETRFATEEYSAPEIWDPSAAIDHRADIFALGVLLYEALTGTRPTGTFRYPSELVPGLDPRLDKVVVQAMQRRPENRFQSCGDMLAGLREAITKKVSPPPKSPTTKVRLNLGTGTVPVPVATPAVVASGVKPVATTPPPAADSVAPPQKEKGTKSVLLFTLAGVVVMAFAAWVVAMQLGKGNADKGAADAPATPGREQPADVTAPAAERTETARERVERRSREQQARLEQMRREQPPKAPDQGMPEDVAAKLQKLDEELRTAAVEPLKTYQSARVELEGNYVALCGKEEGEAMTRGDLEALVFWRLEKERIAGGAEPWPEDAGAPSAAVPVRVAWRERLDTIKLDLEKLHAKYLEDCGRLEAEAESEQEKASARRRYEDTKAFRAFLALCAGTAPPFPEPAAEGDRSGPRAGRADAVRVEYDVLKKILGELEDARRRGEAVGLIKIYGKKLVGLEKELGKDRKEEAQAVTAIKAEMIALLARLERSDGPPTPAPTPAPRPVTAGAVTLLDGGVFTEECRWEKREWRRRGQGMENSEMEVEIESIKGLGPGDFEVSATMIWKTIGATAASFAIGETVILLDGPDGSLHLERGGGVLETERGPALGSVAEAGAPFEVVLRRVGTEFTVAIGGKECLKQPIHGDELGQVKLRTGKAEMQVLGLAMKGAIIPVPQKVVLASHQKPRSHLGPTQLVRLEDEGLLSLFIAYEAGGARESELWMARSRDGGAKWGESEMVTSEKQGKERVMSFAAVSGPGPDQVWLMYAVGEANQNVFVQVGRGGGRSWSREVEVTTMAKKPGDNIILPGCGVALRRAKDHPDRLVIPVVTGTETERQFHVLLSDGGESWKRVGPVIPEAWGEPELIEDGSGTLWMTSGLPNGKRTTGYRLWSRSEDGGETWSVPEECGLPDARLPHGALAFGQDRDGKPVWWHATAEWPVGKEMPENTNLTLFLSRDAGGTWIRARRFHYGRGDSPSIVPLGPGRCAIGFRRTRDPGHTQQIRVVDLQGLGGR